jgi:hypothetical protein
MLTRASALISEIIGEVGGETELPDYYRIGLVSRLVDVREAITMVQYRGDLAVAVALQRADLEVNAAATAGAPGEPGPSVQERIVSWSETIRVLSNNFTAALSVPGAAAYLIVTKDVQGAGVILSTGSPGAIRSAVDKVLQWKGSRQTAIGSGQARHNDPQDAQD